MDTISLDKICELLKSSMWSDRFMGEYYLLDDKIIKLEAMLEKMKNGTLDFKPNCSYDILHEQLIYMKRYRAILKQRAVIEKVVDLNVK